MGQAVHHFLPGAGDKGREETDTTVFLQSPGGVFHGLLCQPALLEINARITIDLTIYPRRQDPFAGGNLIWGSVDLPINRSQTPPMTSAFPMPTPNKAISEISGRFESFFKGFCTWFQRGIHHLQGGGAYPLIQLVH